MTQPRPIEQVCTWCVDMPAATVDNTFGEETNVYRVGNKIFAMVNIGGDEFVTLKTPPEDGVVLRAQYKAVRTGYYMNKRHWITIDLVSEVPMEEVRDLITESYQLVLGSLSKALRGAINAEKR